MSYQKHQVSAEDLSDRSSSNYNEAQNKQLKIIEAIQDNVPQVTVHHKHKRSKKKKIKRTGSHQIKIKLKEIEVLRRKIMELEEAIEVHEKKLSEESFHSSSKPGCFNFWTYMRRRPEILHYQENRHRNISDAGDSREANIDSFDDLNIKQSLNRKRRRRHNTTLVPVIRNSEEIINNLKEKIDGQADDIRLIKSNVEECLSLLKDQKFPYEAKTFNTNLSPAALMFDDCFKSFNRVMPARNYDNVFLRPLTQEQFTRLTEETVDTKTRVKKKPATRWNSLSSGSESGITIRVNSAKRKQRKKTRKKSCCSSKKSKCFRISDNEKCVSFTSANTLRAEVFRKEDTKPRGCFIRFIRFIFCR